MSCIPIYFFGGVGSGQTRDKHRKKESKKARNEGRLKEWRARESARRRYIGQTSEKDKGAKEGDLDGKRPQAKMKK